MTWKNFKIGDAVEVETWGSTFSSYHEMVAVMNLQNWVVGHAPKDGDKGHIIAKVPHLGDPASYGGALYGVRINGQDYIMASNGLKLSFDGVLGGSMMRGGSRA